MNFLDDLKSNFRSWEHGCDNEEDADSLYGLMVSRHPEEDPQVIKEWCYEWVGYDPSDDDLEDEDYWIDPAGGVHPHFDNEEDYLDYDPAKMYE